MSFFKQLNQLLTNTKSIINKVLQRNRIMNGMTQINEHIFINQDELLGRGSTGNVYSGRSQKFKDKKYAVKAIDLSEVNNEVTQYLLSCQIAALSQLAKLNIKQVVKLQDIGFNSKYFYLAMELLQGGSLSEYIKWNPQGLSQEQSINLFKQMIKGYKAIKSKGIVHRDIKPDNLIFRQKYEDSNQHNQIKNICFIDFGYCTKQDVPNRPKAYYNVGSPKYMSPEAYRQNIYSQQSDIWAMGVIFYEMIHGKTIDSGMQMDQYVTFMRNNPIPLTRNVNPIVKKLLQGMLAFDYRKRMTCDQIEQLLDFNQTGNQNFQPIQNHNAPQINILENYREKRNSPFYKSDIMHNNLSDRSNSDDKPNIYNGNLQFDSHRPQKKLSNQNRFKEFNNSPKKMVHLEQSSQRIVQRSMNIAADTNIQINSTIQMKTIHQERLQRIIQQENDIEMNRKNAKNLDNKFMYLKMITQNVNPYQQSLNPNVRIINQTHPQNSLLTPNKSNMRQVQVFRSDVFPSQLQNQANQRNNEFFGPKPYPNQVQKNQIRIITSDKAINNSQISQNFNKSYSTNYFERNQDLKEKLNQRLGLASDFSQQPLNMLPNQPRPVQLLIKNRQVPNNLNNRAFLRNTMPAVYRSFIQNVNPNEQNFHPNEQNFHPIDKIYHSNDKNSIKQTNFHDKIQGPPQKSNMPLSMNLNFIQNSQQTVYKNHAPYFNSSFPYNKEFVQNKPSVNSGHKIVKSNSNINFIQNRQQKSNSLKLINQNTPSSNNLVRSSQFLEENRQNTLLPVNNSPVRMDLHNNVQKVSGQKVQEIQNKYFDLNLNLQRNYNEAKQNNYFVNYPRQYFNSQKDRNMIPQRDNNCIPQRDNNVYIPQNENNFIVPRDSYMTLKRDIPNTPPNNNVIILNRDNRLNEQQPRRSHGVPSQPQRQNKIPTFIINNQKRNIQENLQREERVVQNIQSNANNLNINGTFGQIRPSVTHPVTHPVSPIQFNQPSSNLQPSYFSSKPVYNQPSNLNFMQPNMTTQLNSNLAHRQIRPTYPMHQPLNQALKREMYY